MTAVRRLKLVETEAERRGKAAANEPGQYIFTDPEDYVETMRTLCRNSGLSDKALADNSDGLVKSPATFHNLTDGKFDRKRGDYKRTKNPTLRTTIGLSSATNYAVAFIPRGKK